MNSCYKFKKIIFNDSIFENTIDATYIIHLENNKRLNHIINQLSIYQPTKIVYIVFNKGYKKCNKPKFIFNLFYSIISSIKSGWPVGPNIL